MGEIFERVIPARPLAWTGERLTTSGPPQVEIEHLHRYFLARALCRDLDVLDVAAGEGYGSALMAQTARSVIGVEVSADAVAHAAETYKRANLRFLHGDARRLPLDDASVDVVVSFETIEHFYEHDQFLAEVRRVLRRGGRFIASSPDRDVYSPAGSAANPHHVRELSRNEFSALLHDSFAQVHLLGQRPIIGSALVSDGDNAVPSLTFEKRGATHFEAVVGLPRPVYYVAVASDRPIDCVPDSLYIDTSEVGAVLSAAAATEAATAEMHRLAGCPSAAEGAQATDLRAQITAARAERDAARAEAAAACAARDLARADEEFARSQVAAMRVEVAAACAQRDLARIAARRAAAAAEGHWRRPAARWQALMAVLGRLGILRMAALIPPGGRRFLKERLIRWSGR
jgi:SAM-dependent methyltransferase